MTCYAKSTGAFQRAIIKSGLANCVISRARAQENVRIFLEGMGWQEEDLAQLRTMDAHALQKGQVYLWEHFAYQNPVMFFACPVLDDLFPECPLEAIAKG